MLLIVDYFVLCCCQFHSGDDRFENRNGMLHERHINAFDQNEEGDLRCSVSPEGAVCGMQL
jgi:hypothetical protein